MKQLLILSGKGGTGKTTIASAFINISDTKGYADCDVDAPNLHLTVKLTGEPAVSDYYGMQKAVINQDRCIKCGKCFENCRYNAIEHTEKYKVNVYFCEGCGVCELVCPNNSVSMVDNVSGKLMLYEGEKVFSTAKLNMGSGNSGKLVTEVKKQLISKKNSIEIAIIDGSPGIGCPVIASLSGVDMVLIVAEPTLSGISDMNRIIETTKRQDAEIAVCVNKCDINEQNTQAIKDICIKKNVYFTGTVPFDIKVSEYINDSINIMDTESLAADGIRQVYEKTIEILLNKN